MTEIVISLHTENYRSSFTASIRVCVSAPNARETQLPQPITGGLGEGPLHPDGGAQPRLCNEFVINMTSGIGR